MLRELSEYFKSSKIKYSIVSIALTNSLSGCYNFGNSNKQTINEDKKVENKNYTNFQNLQQLEKTNTSEKEIFNLLQFSYLQQKEGIVAAKAYTLDKKGKEFSIENLRQSEQNIIDTFYLDPSNNNSSTSYKIGNIFIEDLQNILDDILVLLPTDNQKKLFKKLIENPDESFKFKVETKIIKGKIHITYIYITQDKDHKDREEENDNNSFINKTIT